MLILNKFFLKILILKYLLFIFVFLFLKKSLNHIKLPKAIVTGGVIGGVTTLIGLSAVNSSYSNAKAKVSALPVDDHVDVWHEAKHASKRQVIIIIYMFSFGNKKISFFSFQHVVFLLGPPFTNRAVIAKRLTINRHLLPAHGIFFLKQFLKNKNKIKFFLFFFCFVKF